MLSPLVLEHPGRWRVALAVSIACLVLAPALSLLLEPLSGAQAIDAAFPPALATSLGVAAIVALLAFALGWPAGVLARLFDFPARRTLLSMLAVPLLVPSFITSLGLARCRLDGLAGVIAAHAATAVPIVTLVTAAALGALTRSQAEAARLAGNEWHFTRLAARSVRPVAMLSALLAGGLTLGDVGPSQIFGLPSAAGEILVSFSAHYDFGQAARQCLCLAVVSALVATPAIVLLAPRLDAALLARDTQAMTPLTFRPAGRLAVAWIGILLFATVGAPFGGSLYVVLHRAPTLPVWPEIVRTLPGTLFFASGAALVAFVLGSALTLCVGRSRRGQGAALGLALAVLALPPALTALGLLHLGARAPSAADWLLRSGFTPGLALGLRFFPIAMFLGLRRWSEMPPNWIAVAAGSGISLTTCLRRIIAPWFAPRMALAGLLVALLATGEVGTVLLLHPPGLDSFPLAIFTVMANAPESLVASLCLAYLGSAMLFALGLGLWKR